MRRSDSISTSSRFTGLKYAGSVDRTSRLPYEAERLLQVLAHVRVIPVDAGIGKAKRVEERIRPARSAPASSPRRRRTDCRAECRASVSTSARRASCRSAHVMRARPAHLDQRTGHAAVVAEQRDRLAPRSSSRTDAGSSVIVSPLAKPQRRAALRASQLRRSGRNGAVLGSIVRSCPASSPSAATSAASTTARIATPWHRVHVVADRHRHRRAAPHRATHLAPTAAVSRDAPSAARSATYLAARVAQCARARRRSLGADRECGTARSRARRGRRARCVTGPSFTALSSDERVRPRDVRRVVRRATAGREVRRSSATR